MADYQITCINKVDRYNPHERITHVGGGGALNRWRITQQDAIYNIEQKGNRFWVRVNGKSAWVVVATHNGNKYIKTEPDGANENNLLSLDECPV